MQVFILGYACDVSILRHLCQINDEYQLGLGLEFYELESLNQKSLLKFINQHNNAPTLAIIKQTPVLLSVGVSGLNKTALNWQALTHRIVTAGRKSELILQACKLSAGMMAIDGTAGFGHDGLLLASTGANVTLIEQNPIMALLLYAEYKQMYTYNNWRKLLGRIHLIYANCINVLQALPKAEVVYLDPMFPKDSYTAQVSKTMQVLHTFAHPPDKQQENELFFCAKSAVAEGGRVVVKRPVGADNLATIAPTQSIFNSAIRFDIYL